MNCAEICCISSTCGYYLCNCYCFIKILIEEHYEDLEANNNIITEEAEELLRNTSINFNKKYRITSLPSPGIKTKKMKISNHTKRKIYKPSQSYINMNESNMLDVLYE